MNKSELAIVFILRVTGTARCVCIRASNSPKIGHIYVKANG